MVLCLKAWKSRSLPGFFLTYIMFSIVIPLFNESKNIEKLIFEIEVSLKKIRDYEIILVDDGSTDKTSEIIKKNNYPQ